MALSSLQLFYSMEDEDLILLYDTKKLKTLCVALTLDLHLLETEDQYEETSTYTA